MGVWYEIIVEGPQDAVRGFIAGFESGRGERQTLVFGRDLPLAPGSFQERLAGLFASVRHTMLFGPELAVTDLARALRERGAEAGLEVSATRRLTRARFAFRAEVFSRDVVARIRTEMFAGLPEGVALVDVDEHEQVDAQARGQELYSPEHAFVYRLSASCQGPFPGVVEMHRRARGLEFVEPEEIYIEAETLDHL
ncbi:MAG: hypothetical protein ACM3O7_11255 [Acidobacteriota bacterium]